MSFATVGHFSLGGAGPTPDPPEFAATLEDFFSDEMDEEESDDSDIILVGSEKSGKKKRRKKKGKKTKAGAPPPLNPDLTVEEFRKRGKEMIDFIADYIESANTKPVYSHVYEGFMFNKMPNLPPRDPVKMDEVFKELNEVILPGIPQWQSSRHHSLMPAGFSYASLLGCLLCDGLGCIGLTWEDCPAATELEMVVMNWLARLMDLPLDFHFYGRERKFADCSGGGGMIQGTTTETLLTIMVTAKRVTLDFLVDDETPESFVTDKLVAYCSQQAHPSMERVAEVAGIRLKRLWTDNKGMMHADTLKCIMDQDRGNGYFPFLVVATVGTIGSGSVDQVVKIGPECSESNPKVWLHIDAGYAGNSFICREYQPLLHGIDHADSFSMSAHKWLPVHMDCACLWVKKVNHLKFTFGCEDPEGPLTIRVDSKEEHAGSKNMADFRQWSLPMTRRFRAMKLWMVFKLYGVKGLQQKIRGDVRRAKELERLICDDYRFEILGDVMFGIVPFRCKRPARNDINQEILNGLKKEGIIKMTGAKVGNKLWLRFVVTGRTTSDDIRFSWEMIQRVTSQVVDRYQVRMQMEGRYGVPNYTHVNKIGINERLDNLKEGPQSNITGDTSTTNAD